MPEILDYNSFCQDLEDVSSSKIIDKKKFHPHGLFSEQIFGPIKNYTCQCGTYYGISRSGGKCEDCGVDILNSNIRRRRFARIEMPFPVVNPLFYDLIISFGGSKLESDLKLLMRNEKSFLWKSDNEYIVTIDPESIPSAAEKWETIDAIYERVRSETESRIENGEDKWKIIQNNLDQLLIDYIIVLPPDLRPASRSVDKKNHVVDQINRFYQQILTKKETMVKTTVDFENNKKLFYYYFNQIQKDVNELYEHIISKLSKKEGLIRGNILGKRIDFSGRAVIIPDPTLNLDECSLPYLMFLELFKLQIAKRLLEIERFKVLNIAIDFIDKCIEIKNPVLFNLCKEISKGKICLLNRQPSLHRLSMVGFKIKISLDLVIKIHPLVCPGFNADFDGDQMAVYIPITEEAKQEIIEKCMVTKNLTNPANESLTTTPSQDIVLGIYKISTNKLPTLLTEVEFKGQKMTEGMMLINECLPLDFNVVTGNLGKKELILILNQIKEKYSNEILAQVLDNIKKLGFKYSTLYGATMSLDACHIIESEKIQRDLYESGSIGEQLQKVSNETTDILKNTFHYTDMIESGARGSWDQVRQIILTRGFVSNFKGQILEEPIKHSLVDGLNQKEFFTSTYGCRKGLLDVALNTGTSGYLSRKLIFTCANLQISPDVRDCGTEDYLEVFVDTPKKARMLIHKYYRNENGKLSRICQDNFMDFVGKILSVRSPILCKNDRICHTCYGDLYIHLHSRFIGVIAAQSLGECNTQLILRTFHTSGVAVTKGKKSSDQDMRQMDIIADLSSVSKLLHRFDGKHYKDLVAELYTLYNTSRTIHHVHFECVVAQLMWHELEKWRLSEDRETKEIQYHSVQTVPSFESWLLGLAFSNPKKHILKGIVNSGLYKGIMDKILCGEKP